jgi:hypothetical protein
MNGELKMEKILFGIAFLPFIVAISYITVSILLKVAVTVVVDMLGIIGFDEPKRYVSYHYGL